jgi:FdhE protein
VTGATHIWAHRQRRISKLETTWPVAREVLRFFRRCTDAQERLSARLASAPATPDLAPLLPLVGPLLREIEPAAPVALRDAIARWQDAGPELRSAHLSSTLASRGRDGDAPVDALLARILLAPLALRLPAAPEPPASARPPSTCPTCGWPPLASVLSEDADAAAVRRALVCALCARSWSFPRVLCPACGEERPDSLPRYSADDIPWIRVEACDTCHRYLKAIDLPHAPDADPTTDELASLPLDVIARERGYHKIVANILGV